ncbi:hypothetical protein [Mucilaginibacter inviolabilis]|uniref:hypothetical protein n=1 Tax=Mucilaginibacter inviolabilis TaxID=2714892 RepID=UPI001408FB8F|nr:hypothetical protein [Mucilaginibacter inviolabilis]
MKNESINVMTVQRAKELLAKDGVIVNDKQAKEILEFLQTIADIAVAQYLRSKRNGSSTNS